jgi:hypothetical protein
MIEEAKTPEKFPVFNELVELLITRDYLDRDEIPKLKLLYMEGAAEYKSGKDLNTVRGFMVEKSMSLLRRKKFDPFNDPIDCGFKKNFFIILSEFLG